MQQYILTNITSFGIKEVNFKCVIVGRSSRQITISDFDETSLMCAFMLKKIA